MPKGLGVTMKQSERKSNVNVNLKMVIFIPPSNRNQRYPNTANVKSIPYRRFQIYR